jgi:hypothetical protein
MWKSNISAQYKVMDTSSLANTVVLTYDADVFDRL